MVPIMDPQTEGEVKRSCMEPERYNFRGKLWTGFSDASQVAHTKRMPVGFFFFAYICKIFTLLNSVTSMYGFCFLAFKRIPCMDFLMFALLKDVCTMQNQWFLCL